MERNNEQRPSAALINREWLEAAQSVLSREDLAKAVLCACEYVLYGQIKQSVGGSMGVVLAMVKPSLDSDIAKYRERCARNAANARSGSQRVGASGSESQRVGANTTTTTTTTTTPSLSPVEVKPEEIEREKWLIFGYFWSVGSKAITEECNAFWSYYESLGWKNNKGAVIVDKIACARMWRRQYETGTAPDGSKIWFSVVRSCPVPDYNIWGCYAGMERNEHGMTIRLRCTPEFLKSLRESLPAMEKSLQAALKAPAVTFEHIR